MNKIIALLLCFSASSTFAMTTDQYLFLSGLLHAGRISEKMDCQIKARELKEERQFSDGKKLVEYIKIDFTTAHLGPRSATISIPEQTVLKTAMKVHEDWGPVEELKMELNDLYNSNVTILHTGDRIVYFEIVNTLAIYLCGVKIGK